MDYLRSYSTLIDQSRFYFPPLTSVSRGSLADQRLSSVTADVLTAPPGGLAAAAALTPLRMLHGSAIHDGLTRSEREIPLDLSLKTLSQTPDSTADDDVITQQRVAAVNARNHALQVAAALATGKFPFTPLDGAGGAANSRLRDPFLPPPPQNIYSTAHHLAPPILIRPLASATPTSVSSNLSSNTTVSSVTSGFSRGPSSSDSGGGTGSAFVAPHSAICGGLNGFCLDPRRCRLAAATSGSNGAGAAGTNGSSDPNHVAASAFHAYAAAIYERHMSKLLTTSAAAAAAAAAATSTTTSAIMSQTGATGALQGLAEIHMSLSSSAKAPPSSSTASSNTSSSKSSMTSSSTSTTSSSTALKNPFSVAIGDPFFHSTFPLSLNPYHPHQQQTTHSSNGGGDSYHLHHDGNHHHHHNHTNRLSKDPNCACCNVGVTKPYPLSCLCCYPTVTAASSARAGYEAAVATATSLFACCPPSSAVPVIIPNVTTYVGHSQSSVDTKTKSSKHHHHHHHHHRHEKNTDSSSSSMSPVTTTTKQSGSDSKRSRNTPPSVDVVKEDGKGRLPSSSSPSLSVKQPSPPEGGRWIPHVHSNHSEKMNSSSRRCTPTGSESTKTSTNKVFAPVVRIPPSPPEGVFQGPSKAPSPHVSSASVPPPPPSPAVNRPTAFTAVYPTRSVSRSLDVVTPTPRRQTSPLDVTTTANGASPAPQRTGAGGVQLVSAQELNDGRESSCSPPKMAKVTPTVIKKEQEEHQQPSVANKSNGQWTLVSPRPSSPSARPGDKQVFHPQLTEVNCLKEKMVVYRVWDANYTSDNVPEGLAVTPVDVKNETITAPPTPSPAEASPPTATVAYGRNAGTDSSNDGEDGGRRRTEAATPISNGVRSEKVVSPLVVKATTVEHEKNAWKRLASEPTNASCPAKKLKKKDVIVISMKDEHQISTNLLMKSVKRKLEEPKGQCNSSGERQRTPPIAHQQLTEIKQQLPTSSSLNFPDVHLSTSVHTASVVTTTTTTARFTSSQPDVVTPLGNHDDKNSILKLSVKIPAGLNANSSGGNHACVKTGARAQDCLPDEKPPVVGITLTKTGGDSGPTALYKSSVLNSTNASTVSTTASPAANEFSPAISDTAAMLRRYYEDQKLRLQQAEEFNRLRFTKGNNPLTNAPLKDTLASSSSSTTLSVTLTSITAPTIDTKPRAIVTVTTTSSPVVTAMSKPSLSVTQQPSVTQVGCPFLSKPKQQQQQQQQQPMVDDAADDGDDEREDDDEFDDEDDEDEDDDDDYEDEDDDDEDEDDDSDDMGRSGKTGNKDGERKRNTITNGNMERLQVSSKSSHVNNHVANGVEGSEVSKGITNSNSSTIQSASGLMASSAGHKSDNNSKRVMYNKALGETMLHRAARLGQMDHLKYYLETQGSTIDARDNAGYSPLHECCSRGHIDAAKMLLQYGADVNSAAAGGVRPIHDAVENDYLEVVRLLLSYGADPLITTYSGLSPLKLARSSAMMEFFKGFLADVTGESSTPILPWQFRGSARCLDTTPSGYDPLDDLPSEDEGVGRHQSTSGEDCDVDDDAALIFEVSDKPHIPTYHVPATRRNGSGILSFCLLQDVLNQTGMNRGAFLACYPDTQVERMARQEFISQAKCTQIMVDPSAALKTVCPTSTPWVELVHWDSNLREILDIERVAIPTNVFKTLNAS